MIHDRRGGPAIYERTRTQLHSSYLDRLLDGSEPFLGPDGERLGVAAPC